MGNSTTGAPPNGLPDVTPVQSSQWTHPSGLVYVAIPTTARANGADRGRPRSRPERDRPETSDSGPDLSGVQDKASARPPKKGRFSVSSGR